MQDRGEIVKKAIRKQGFKVNKIAELLGRSRRSMYDVFNKPDVSLDLIIELEKIIHYDFSAEIKELKKYRNANEVSNASDDEHNYHKDYYKNKYYELLEKYNTLMEELVVLRGRKGKK